MSEIQRDLASTELWNESLERSLRRRALAPIARKREARRKRTSIVAGAAVATAPVFPTLTAADAASPGGRTHDNTDSHRLADQGHERILLRTGDTSPAVGELQQALEIQVDQIFGPQTEAAVRALQARSELPVTGKVDARTWLTLFPHDAIIAVTGPTPPGSSHSAEPTAQWAAVTVPTTSKTPAKSTTARAAQAISTASDAEPAVFGHGSGGVHASLIGASQKDATAAPQSAAPESEAPASSHQRASTPPAATTPAPTTISVPGSTGGQGIQIQAPTPGSAQTAAEMVAEMLAAADAIDSHHYAYRWGGGHDSSFGGPYDCSGAVSAVLHAAGLVSAPMVSGDFMRWGAPGPGTVTIYANAGHVYMSINGKFFGTSYSNPGGGAGWFQGGARPGFVVVHVPFERMHLRSTAARAQAAKTRRNQRRHLTAVAAVQPRTSGSGTAPAAGTGTGNGGVAYAGASAPAAAQPQSPAATPGTAAPVAPAADTPAAAVAPSAEVPATVAPSASAPATVAPSSDVPATVAPSSAAPAPAPSPTPDVAPAPAPASAPDTTAPTAAAPAPNTVAPPPAASAPTTTPSPVEPASAVTTTPPATQPAAAPTDPPTGESAGTPATDTASQSADPGAQDQTSASATGDSTSAPTDPTSDATTSAPAASDAAPAAVPAAA